MDEPVTSPAEPEKPETTSKFDLSKWLKENKKLAITLGSAIVVILLLVVIFTSKNNDEDDFDVSDSDVTIENLEINTAEDLETAKTLLQGSVDDNPEEIEELRNIGGSTVSE